MKQLLIATTNPSKFEEAVRELESEGLEILDLKSFIGLEMVEETGETFEENALLKARGYFEQTGIPCVADDGGLMVDALGGAPGVASHRWLGEGATDDELAATIIEKMKGVPQGERIARIGGIIIFFDGEHVLKRENYTEGYIADSIMGEVRPGFPYRPILMISEFGKSYSDLTDEEHDAVNFRRKNFREMKPKILELLGISS